MILNIETTADVCSVSLSEGNEVKALKESAEGHSHATMLTVCAGELLSEAGLAVSDLDAVSVSMGPGSYTGLRIGVSTAKGLCYGAGVPLLAVSTAEVLVQAFLAAHAGDVGPDWRLAPMIDARRMEVYTALYDREGTPCSEVHAEIVTADSFSEALAAGPVAFFGPGAMKCADILTSDTARFYDGIRASAAAMATLSARALQERRWCDVAYFTPFYLKEFMATTPRKKW
ncbi:MAG: tRNA (adenosine(37)-N6)-threonylcarbamoyltransferase complex dimerization subunit type 1 TsaB [Bacteroidales bacterium]|nr:tRNA (adenosine(37)-N6)-threonylcarbamoyltransferase complex dimerization subunit type 1 TsaB [Bacteroidales bacterium]MBQ7213013.1 tRNA (adenosine(37)-N6)-threonylcarbamoyltransferase complex dimerization subunit type 1 TsaB [Bacteroidales bacterium]